MTKRILITGGNSFIGKSIAQSDIFKNHQVWHPGRHVLDINNLEYLKIQLKEFKPDFIIHTAWEGDSYENDNEQSFSNNIQMLQNLLDCKDLYKKLIIFGSGIEFIKGCIEVSKAYYHEAKLVTALMARGQDKLIKLNLWNVFGRLEDSRRFISKCIKNFKENEDVNIYEDRLFDFFYIDDLTKLINYLIENPPEYFVEMDCTYKKKLSLLEVAYIIRNLTNSKSKIIIKKSDNDYIGKGNNLLNYKGLEQGIKEMI